MLLALLLSILAGSNVWSALGLDSIEACQTKRVNDSCQFNLPSVDDRFSFPELAEGEEESGVCQERGVNMYCRAVPSQSQISACNGLGAGAACTIQAAGQDTTLVLEAVTKDKRWADTQGAVYVSWRIGGVWTPPQLFFRRIGRGERKQKTFIARGWPEELALTVNSNDAWGFWKITLNDLVVIEDPEGTDGGANYCSYHPPQYSDTCEEFRMTKYWIEGPPAAQVLDVVDYGTGDSAEGAQTVTIEAHTSEAERANTNGCINIVFVINGQWTTAPEGLEFFCGAELGAVKRKTFNLPGWPSKVRLSINSTDTWAFWKLTINDLVLIEDPAGKESSHGFEAMSHENGASSYWLESPPRTATLQIPSKPADLEQGSVHNQPGKCDTAWNGVFFCDDKQYVDRKPATTVPDARRAGTWYVYTQFAIRGVSATRLVRDEQLLDSFVEASRTAIAGKAGPEVELEDIGLRLERGYTAVIMTSVIELTKALQEKGLTVDNLYRNLRGVGPEVKQALEEIGLENFDVAVLGMEEVHEATIKASMDESQGNPVQYQHNGQDCVRPRMTDSSIQGMICSRNDAESGINEKVCAWDPDVNESTLCTWKECEQKCAGADWCSAFSVSDYTDRGAEDEKEQCWLFEKCFTMDDHDAYKTWPPSCVAPDPEKTGRENMQYESPMAPQYYDVDATYSRTEGPIEVRGSAAGAIIGIIIGAGVCLILVVVLLVCYVRKLRRQLKDSASQSNPNVAIGRPVVQTSAAPAGAVVGGIPVVNAGEVQNNEANEKGQKQAGDCPPQLGASSSAEP